ncbi:hypothetical protein Thermo_00385 [Thermoplasmatales archaeon]|nr:hypothetical protein Thermo_00385 [Thermoplasmatales archaeon]
MQPNSGNDDIRQEVTESRGLLKKIQLLIPGFRAYRIGDDLRVADEMLRKQVSNNLNMAMAKLVSARSQMASDGDFQNLTPIGSALSKIQQLDGEILHSAQGYTGISPAIRIDESKLNALYEYDLSFVDSSAKINDAAGTPGITSGDTAALSTGIANIIGLIAVIRDSWRKRIDTVEKIIIAQKGETS